MSLHNLPLNLQVLFNSGAEFDDVQSTEFDDPNLEKDRIVFGAFPSFFSLHSDG